MKTKRKTLALVLVLFGGVFALIMFGYNDLKEGSTVRTSSNAAPADVTFLRLPPTASRIGYFRDGLNYCAEFGVTEREFGELFNEFKFQEISQPVVVQSMHYGDPQMFHHLNANLLMVTNGLHYRERRGNGGGYTIVYDRSQSRAYYDFAKR
jgi:hypothetical protein